MSPRYIRDIAFDYQYIGESFETSLPFSCTINLSRNVKDAIIAICEEEGVEGKPFASCRVTQLYDTGVCVYFYFVSPAWRRHKTLLHESPWFARGICVGAL